MATAPPYFVDPSLIHLTMPNPPPAPAPRQSRLLDIFKILVGLFVALLLSAIFVVLMIVPRTSYGNGLRESNENIAKLQRESNENIARLQRESAENLTRLLRAQQLQIETQRLERQENITELHRLQDQLIESGRHREDSAFAMVQLQQQLQLEQRRLQLLLEDRQLTEQHRKEDLNRISSSLLSEFTQEVISAKQPLNETILQLKVESLIRRIDAHHKSLLIRFLYKMKYLTAEHSDSITLDLQGANLKDLDLDDMDTNSGYVGLWLNYTQLALPSTILINASFEQLHMNKSNFTSSNLMGASFRWSNVVQTDFSRATLSLSSFQWANVSQSHFSNVKMRSASFQNADLSETYLSHSDFGSTNFQEVKGIGTIFSHSELSSTNFEYANLYQAQMDRISARSANFYSAKFSQGNFSNSDISSCVFLWADLSGSLFRKTFLAGTSFENANVHNVDFTGAILPGAIITPGQLDVALSIANTILPDGSMGRNKNLVRNGDAQCTGINGTIPSWNSTEYVFTNGISSSNDCVFQTKIINGTLQQRINMRRYERLIQYGQSNVYIEMQMKPASGSLNPSNPPVYMNVRFFDSDDNENGSEQSTLNQTRSISPSTLASSLPCPSTTMELEVTLVFREVNATVDNIYVTIE